jgi:hypothetical protein
MITSLPPSNLSIISEVPDSLQKPVAHAPIKIEIPCLPTEVALGFLWIECKPYGETHQST